MGGRDQRVLEPARGGIIVSCQAYPGDPLNDPVTMGKMAESVVLGGAAAVRAQGLDDIRTIRARVAVAVIGLVKVGTEGVFITPTLDDALCVAEAGAQVVAVDGTRRQRPDGLTLAQTIGRLRSRTGVEVMADCGSLADAQAAERAGADYLGTTLAGYTGERRPTPGPDFGVLEEIVATCAVPVIAEGRFRTPADARAALALGAFAVCVGSAITHPGRTTAWFVRGSQG